MNAELSEAQRAWRLLANHGLLDTDLPSMLDIWPDVTVLKRCPDPNPDKARRHPGSRICDRCNQWLPVARYPHDGGVCVTCLTTLSRPKRRRSACRA